MSLIGLASAGLRTALRAVESLEPSHGPWCEHSKAYGPETHESRIVPIRIGDDYIARMTTEEGWAADIAGVFIRPTGDGTFQMFFREAEEVDHASNRVVQRMMLTAMDLAQALDTSNCDLSDEVVDALAEFKRACRSRLGGGVL